MSTQLIKQPNGLYALFNSGVDGITSYDMSPAEYVGKRIAEAVDKAKREALEVLQLAEKNGTSAYAPFDETWESAYAKHLDNGYDPIELLVSKTPDLEEVVALGKESLRINHPTLYEELKNDG